MGKVFGNLAFIRGILYYSLSPHELKPFANASQGMINFVPRTFSRIYTWLPVFLAGIYVYQHNEHAHKQKFRKKPGEFDDEMPPEEEKICGKKKKKPKKECPKPEEEETVKTVPKLFLGGYGLYHYAEYLHWAYQRKNPADYANEKPPPEEEEKCPPKEK